MPRVLKCDVLRHAWDDVESLWFVKKDSGASAVTGSAETSSTK
jgi:hypothetical protein